MGQCLRDRKKVQQKTVNSLVSFFKLARYYDYSVEEAKKVAVLSVESAFQGGRWETGTQAMRIAQRSTHGGKETAETYDRLVAGREATEEVNLWYLEGVLVDEQIVKAPETQTLEQIDTEDNAEVRRIRIERFGWPRYLRESKAKVIDVRDNDIDATKESLMEINFNTETQTWNDESGVWDVEVWEKARVLVCACPSTAKVFVMRVPNEIRDCESAQRWLHGNRKIRVIGAS